MGRRSQPAAPRTRCSICSTSSERSGSNSTLEVGYTGNQSRKVALPGQRQRADAGHHDRSTPASPIRNGTASSSSTATASPTTTRSAASSPSVSATASPRMFSYTWSRALDENSAIRGTGSDFTLDESALPLLRLRPCRLQHSAPLRDVDPLHAALRQRAAVPESRRRRGSRSSAAGR